MSLNLNSLAQERVEKNLERSLKSVEKFLPQVEVKQDDHQLNYRVGTSSLKAGYMLYQLERNDEAKRLLKISSSSKSREHYYASIPTESHESRNAWSFFEALCIGICFGDDESIGLMTKTEEIKYYHLPNDPGQNQFIADTNACLKTYLSCGSVEPAPLEALKASAKQSNRNKEEQTFVVPVALGLHALVSDSENDWNKAVQSALDGHMREVQTGDYRRSEQGFICMPGLALIKLGQAKGWACPVESLYLPTQLLG